ncbi:uncharacterized protein LOC108742303 isoform X3 [Agrilus planipennis]|nr:uncharacterized protein LOC108742303 isoform X3 [Agrilus planipennis]
MLSFPPHCTHRLQPLDRSVFGPLKKYVNNSMDQWMVNHPGQAMTIYEIPGIVAQAFPLAATPSNIVVGFKACGICSFNRDIFQEHDFMPSSVTDRPLITVTDPDIVHNTIQNETDNSDINSLMNSDLPVLDFSSLDQNDNANFSVRAVTPQGSGSSVPEISQQDATKDSTTNTYLGSSGLKTSLIISPQVLKPLPKALPRKSQRVDRRKCKSAILTDTPEKTFLEEKKKEQESKKKKVSKRVFSENKENKKASKGKKIKKTTVDSDEDEKGDEDFCLICLSSTSKSREIWLQCQDCKLWAHKECTPGLPNYVCHNCDSEYSD